MRATVVAGAVAAGALGLVACGGGAQTGAGPVGAASHLPAGSLVYVEASTDLESAQWQTTLDLARRFPGFDTVIADATAAMKKDGVDFERDIRPLLGDGAALAVVSVDPAQLTAGRSAGSGGTGSHTPPPTVAAIDIADGKDAAVEALITTPMGHTVESVGAVSGTTIYRMSGGSSSERAWMAVDNGALVVGSSEAVLKQAIEANRSGTTMASSQRLRSVLDTLPSETIAQGYVDMARVVEVLKQSAPAATVAQIDRLGIGPDGALGMSLTAEDQGVRIRSIARDYHPAGTAQAFSPTLTSTVPADAVALLEVGNLFEAGRTALDSVAQSEQTKSQVQQAKGALALIGVSTDDLKTLLGGELGLVVGQGADPGVPDVAAILGTGDGTAAASILDRLASALTRMSGGQVPAFAPVDLANGVRGFESKVDPKASVVYGVDGDRALIGSSVAAVSRLQAPKVALADDGAFAAATDQMPARVSGLVWLNGDRLLTLMTAADAFATAPADLLPNLRHVRNIAAWSTAGDQPTFEAFITIK